MEEKRKQATSEVKSMVENVEMELLPPMYFFPTVHAMYVPRQSRYYHALDEEKETATVVSGTAPHVLSFFMQVQTLAHDKSCWPRA